MKFKEKNTVSGEMQQSGLESLLINVLIENSQGLRFFKASQVWVNLNFLNFWNLSEFILVWTGSIGNHESVSNIYTYYKLKLSVGPRKMDKFQTVGRHATFALAFLYFLLRGWQWPPWLRKQGEGKVLSRPLLYNLVLSTLLRFSPTSGPNKKKKKHTYRLISN